MDTKVYKEAYAAAAAQVDLQSPSGTRPSRPAALQSTQVSQDAILDTLETKSSNLKYKGLGFHFI